MKLLSWWQNLRSVRSAGLALYKRGMTQANEHNEQAAMECYTDAIQMQDVPEDVRAMALYNRALLHAASKDYTQAQTDLNAVLAIPAPLHQIKSAARQKLDRMKLRQAADHA